jgi:ketosteroid isomerase-like protein
MSTSPAALTQQDARAALFAADAAHTAAIERLGPIDGIVRAMRGNALYLTPGKDIIRGRHDIRESLVEENPDAAVAHLSRVLLGGDVSADGNFGFTFGWLNRTAPEGLPYGAYVAVWERDGDDGFRVTAYYNQRSPRRVPARDGFPLLATGPGAGGVPHRESMDRLRRSLIDVDSQFAALSVAQGYSIAFPAYSNPDFLLVFGGNFIGLLGEQEIVDAYAGWTPAEELAWTPLYSGASGSGDLGFTVGNATTTVKGADGSIASRSYSKYLTLWARTADGSWRFIADGGSPRPPPQS